MDVVIGGGIGRTDLEERHRMPLTKGLWLAKTETTQIQWEAMMAGNPSLFKGPELPVETVSWDDTRKRLAEMNRKHPLPEGWLWGLPTEAQWKYASRAGRGGAYGSLNLDVIGWHDGNRVGKPNSVGKKHANDRGFYDLHGNVWE